MINDWRGAFHTQDPNHVFPLEPESSLHALKIEVKT
jgi:hypothetical protein